MHRAHLWLWFGLVLSLVRSSSMSLWYARMGPSPLHFSHRPSPRSSWHCAFCIGRIQWMSTNWICTLLFICSHGKVSLQCLPGEDTVHSPKIIAPLFFCIGSLFPLSFQPFLFAPVSSYWENQQELSFYNLSHCGWFRYYWTIFLLPPKVFQFNYMFFFCLGSGVLIMCIWSVSIYY
jgi:hypothetical protein